MSELLRVLMVEDDAQDADLAERQLTKSGMRCEIRRVQTESEFLRALRESRPDVIVTDVSLPQFDGMKALELAVREAPDVPFIFVSGTIGEERAIESLKRGAIDYVLKSSLARLPSAVERALREASMRAARRQAEQMLRDIVESSQDWIWQLDSAGRFTFSSPAVALILGYRPDEILGRHYAELLHEDDAALAASLLPAAENGSPALNGVIAGWRHRHGQQRWLERNAMALHGLDGRLVGYRGTDRDVTVRRQQEIRIERLSRAHRMLSSINSAIVRTRRRPELFEEACRNAVHQGGYARATIDLLEPGDGTLRTLSWAGVHSENLAKLVFSFNDSAAHGSSLSARAVFSGSPIACNDLRNEQHLVFRDEYLRHGLHAAVALPLLVGGKAIGAMVLSSREAGVFDEAELGVLGEMAANIGFALQYFEKEDAVHFLSFFDQVTGLRRRTLFCEHLAHRLEAAGAADKPLTVVVFDVQRLSLINDTYGRSAGDQLLAQIAARMRRQFENEESLAHFGGGTFAAAFTETIDPRDTVRLQSAMSKIIVESFAVEGRELRPSICSGIAYFPHDGSTAEVVVQNAEAALRKAREDGNKHQFYALMDKGQLQDRLAIEARLTGALARSEYRLHYQPKIAIKTGRVEGVEALLRWQDPEAGLVSAPRFIPLLESTGAIVEVGQWVLEQAARDCQAWMNLGLDSMRIAVNVSTLQLRQRDFVERTIAVVRGWSTDHAGLDIEITESMLMHDLDSSARKLQRVREAGLQVAIDDFGTGYSSLRHLAKLPVDTLKIDRSFTQGVSSAPNDLTIVSTIVSLAHAFGMTCVAEGVETAEQLNVLRLMRCDSAQGFLFSRPIPAEAIPELVLRLHAD